MPLAMSRPWKHPRTGVYYLRKGVPDDLRQLVGKREEKRSLETRDPVEAKRRHAEALADVEVRWANLRAGPKALTEREAHQLAVPVHDRWLRQYQEKPMFKEAYRKRRCIVPMDAFYEKKKGRLYKFFMKDRQPFGVAGIWENWRNLAGDWERTFCIITVEANDLVRKIHDRMPAIINAADHQRWFDGGDDLLVPYPAEKMGVMPA
jgi:putative SOS response-associated peptidase YedK